MNGGDAGMRTIAAFATMLLLVAGCGGGDATVDEYVETLNGMYTDYSPRGEAAYVNFLAIADPTMDDLQALLDTNVALRVDVQRALEDLDAPEPIEDLNESWVGWHGRFLDAAEGLAARAATARDWQEYLDSAEFTEWGLAMSDGAQLCDEFEGHLNSTESEDLFADTAWMPSELTDVVQAVIGCDSFPDDLDDLAAIYGK